MAVSRLCANIITTVPEIRACNQNNQTSSETSADPPVRKLKVSPQLNRWSRARALRSGRKLDRPAPQIQTLQPDSSSSNVIVSCDVDVSDGDVVEGVEVKVAKSIYIVSDGTGWTAEHCVNAALGQFDYCLVDHGCPVSTHLFSGVIS